MQQYISKDLRGGKHPNYEMWKNPHHELATQQRLKEEPEPHDGTTQLANFASSSTHILVHSSRNIYIYIYN